MNYFASLSLIFVVFCTNAVIKRHDVDPDLYKVDNIPDFYVDMPFQGGSVLIGAQWLVAPAHVIYTFMYDYEDKPIMVHGVENRISEVILHPEYKREGGKSSKDEDVPLIDQLNNNKDIALIRLALPVTHIKPIAFYTGNDELGMEITGFGRGAIGTGTTGEKVDSEGPSLITYSWYQITKFFSDWAFTQEEYPLHSYKNEITEAKGPWLRFTFEQGENALPLEGTIGSGDSGGAVIIYENSIPILLGLAAWREFDGDVKEHIFGKYGETSVVTRVSYFQNWIYETTRERDITSE